MLAYDFEYDGLLLSDKGFVICHFDGNSGFNTISAGSQITFNKVSTLGGAKYEQTSSTYEECLTSTIQICKNTCDTNEPIITLDEYRELMKWLNRKTFHKFKIIDDDYVGVYFEASFNVSRIEVNGKLVGLELAMETNRPFALQEPRTITINNTEVNGKKTVVDFSDEEGYIYPKTVITCRGSGDLSIVNALENRTVLITGCIDGEIITMDYPVISTSVSTHKIQENFNWNFLRLANNYRQRENELTISIPCIIEMTYSPVIKISF